MFNGQWTNGQPNLANYPVNWTSSTDGVTRITEDSYLDIYLIPAADSRFPADAFISDFEGVSQVMLVTFNARRFRVFRFSQLDRS